MDITTALGFDRPDAWAAEGDGLDLSPRYREEAKARRGQRTYFGGARELAAKVDDVEGAPES